MLQVPRFRAQGTKPHEKSEMYCVWWSSFTQNCPNKEKRNPKCANCRGPHVANYKGCATYKNQAFRQHVDQTQVSYAYIIKQAPPPPDNTLNFTADQIISLVTNVVIQVAQPQLCTKNLPAKQVQAKSDLSKQIAETAKNV